MGVVTNLGFMTSVVMELWSALQGLTLAWANGLRDVILETNSKVVV